MEFHRARYRKATRFLAYFQSYSNTYADLDSLRAVYQQALEIPGIVGIVVGTRPDCVDAEKLDYFAELSRKCHVVLEYGLESLRDDTLERVNRGHSVEVSARAVRETAQRGIITGGHMIIGLPGETRDDYMEMARELSTWPLNNIKYHQLQVIHGTAMAREYKERPEDFPWFSLDEYLGLMMELISYLNPSFVVERIAGEVMPGMAARNGWGVRYDEVLKRFEALLEQHDVWQGKNFKEEEE
jgi:radical SAM protein (TIGR01212 family)